MDSSQTKRTVLTSLPDDKPLSPQQQLQALNALRKTALSREAIVEVQRMAMSLEGDEEALMWRVADFLLEARQVLRGGKLNISSGKHWFNDA